MFNNKKEKNVQIIDNTNYKVKVLDLESKIEIKDIEINSLQKKLKLKEEELNDYEVRNKELLIEENTCLKKQVEKLEFDINNNTENIELKTKNAKLKSELEVEKSENTYLKTLLNTYQELPDIKRMIENLSSIAIPNIDELKEFTSTINESGIKDLSMKINANTEAVKDMLQISFRGYHE